MNLKDANISIVVPSFNKGEFLAECLDSILRQTYERWFCIVVDDCSDNDDLSGVVSRFEDSRIMIIRHERNKGVGAARNTGFRAATTDLVLPVDFDDMLQPRFLETTGEFLNSNLDFDCVYTDFQLFGDSNEVWHYSVKTPADMAKEQWIPGPGTLMRKCVWERCGGYDELPPPYHGNDDWDFWISAISIGLKPFHIPEPLYCYRRTASSVSLTTLAYNEHITRKRIFKRHRDFFNAHNEAKKFLAQGFLKSSCAAFSKNERVRAAWLALRGLALVPVNRSLQRQLLLSLVPPWTRNL